MPNYVKPKVISADLSKTDNIIKIAFSAICCYLNDMKALMVQGTSSHAGKSIITAAILRALRRRGISCCPFKPQNMALNSYVTMDGYEIGRAQAMQAEAAKVLPSVYMNPILLKPTADSTSQVVVLGKPYKNLNAREYLKEKKRLINVAVESFERLNREFDAVIVEGAGSPAEINLRKDDIANMGFAKKFQIPVIIVGDIDRGGIYASFYGTYSLLTKMERALVKGFLINKFRGDSSLLTPANEFIEKKTGVPVIGVIPYFRDLKINDEDGVSLTCIKNRSDNQKPIKIGVIKLPRISNFTDFEPFQLEKDVELRYISTPEEAQDLDLIIIPGSKNTIEDLLFLKNSGFEDFLKRYVKKEGELIGICGGYQMLGKKVCDPYGVESHVKEIKGLAFLPAVTIIEKEKRLKQVTFDSMDGRFRNMRGYEIHMGVTKIDGGISLFRVYEDGREMQDGCKSENLNVWGTYLHGIFDNDEFRLELLNRLRRKKNLKSEKSTFSYIQYKDRAYEELADIFEENADFSYLLKLIGI